MMGGQSGSSKPLPELLLEARAAGVPIVATAVGGVPSLLDHGERGAELVGGVGHEALLRREEEAEPADHGGDGAVRVEPE